MSNYDTGEKTVITEAAGKGFKEAWDSFAESVFGTAKRAGFHEDARHPGVRLALIHSEISEALEGLRQGNPPDAHLPHLTSAEVELADAVIRIMHLARYEGWDVGRAIYEKALYNETRPRMHGKLF